MSTLESNYRLFSNLHVKPSDPSKEVTGTPFPAGSEWMKMKNKMFKGFLENIIQLLWYFCTSKQKIE